MSDQTKVNENDNPVFYSSSLDVLICATNHNPYIDPVDAADILTRFVFRTQAEREAERFGIVN